MMIGVDSQSISIENMMFNGVIILQNTSCILATIVEEACIHYFHFTAVLGAKKPMIPLFENVGLIIAQMALKDIKCGVAVRAIQTISRMGRLIDILSNLNVEDFTLNFRNAVLF
jgi:hypothetical protein